MYRSLGLQEERQAGNGEGRWRAGSRVRRGGTLAICRHRCCRQNAAFGWHSDLKIARSKILASKSHLTYALVVNVSSVYPT